MPSFSVTFPALMFTVAVAFVWEQEPEVEQALKDSKIRFEAIHRFDLDDGLARVS